MEQEEEPHAETNVPTARWYNYVGDFFNTLKAFIGTNYLALGFAFKQSGLALGIIGVFFIAVLTDHCCQMMVRCKYFVINIMMEEERVHHPSKTQRQMADYKAKLEKTIGYGDLGRIALGKYCAYLIDFAVWFTQFLTCVAYFIFIANTVYSIFPMKQVTARNRTLVVDDADGPFEPPCLFTDMNNKRSDIAINMLNLVNLNTPLCEEQLDQLEPTLVPNLNSSVVDSLASNTTSIYTVDYILGQGTSTADPNITTTANPNVTTTAKPPPPTPYYISTSPDMRLLFLVPLPIWLLSTLVRKLRVLSPLTVVATLALFVGAISVLAFILNGFHVSNDFKWFKLYTLPVFLGQLIGAYEGIGCILPIESSMDGNRWAFKWMLHGSVYIVFVILTAFGSLGYLRYGEGITQLITQSIKQHTPLSIAVDVTLIISVLFTYPLQCFPVVTITERYVFGPGKCCGPRVEGDSELNGDHIIQNDDSHGLLDSTTSIESNHSDVAVQVPSEVPSWKRNLLRIVLTFSIMGFGILMWDAYAYLGAVSGAIGCSLLAYILPCLIHLKIKGRVMRLSHIIKDVCVIFLSFTASVLTLVVIIGEIVTGKIRSGS